MSVVNATQRFPANTQVMGISAVFLQMAEALNLDPGDLLRITKNMLKDGPTWSGGVRHEFAAVGDYMRLDVRPKLKGIV